MTTLTASFESQFRQKASTFLRAMLRGAEIEAEASADLVLLGGLSQGALWRRGDHYEFVPADQVRADVASLANRTYQDRGQFLKTAEAAGLKLVLTLIRF